MEDLGDILSDTPDYPLSEEQMEQMLNFNDMEMLKTLMTTNVSSVNQTKTITHVNTVPLEISFSSNNLVSVIAYSCLFVIAAVGNLTVFITLFRTRRRKSRVNCFIMHLATADLIVTFIMLPLETVWHIVVAWRAGDFACRLLMFCRAFGFYLSSFILVAISLDRYFSIVHPLSIHDADKRGKLFLIFSWVLSVSSSLPQVRCCLLPIK